ncbi:MAG: phosphoribosylglycinamide formyltransferase [Sarcina sp.]|uniref:phosphoribosylglycinamide formyltransferase n=1 Tax=Sarcina sp. DSM 11001 TaxID=1798184 RepID=UPI0008871A5C|nr:phosphoribosylglycinamide formyltransferase [Sarcina sp. DSM 11001]MBE6002047.1 phosphoribosylglycinamide formyltransferase [Sarcina sp.]SDK59146.1 formyltetrahydrofolate-dependent phosphoribosylglycinamide formyltransferase [Sarcina sp. DSM 11001]
MLKITVCVSGGGTNLQAIIDRLQDGTIRNARIVQVISNNPGAYALERAAAAGLDACCVSPKNYPDREAFNDALLDKINEAAPDLIVLAGFMVAVPRKVCAAYAGRIINIHPALIPSFCGKGYYGLHVHEKALARGVKVTGATVHFVDEDLDTGPIILQKAVEIREDDTPQTLQRRVMEEAEWIILPRAIDLIAAGRVRIEGRRTRILDE